MIAFEGNYFLCTETYDIAILQVVWSAEIPPVTSNKEPLGPALTGGLFPWQVVVPEQQAPQQLVQMEWPLDLDLLVLWRSV